jgi:hypothetical protein
MSQALPAVARAAAPPAAATGNAGAAHGETSARVPASSAGAEGARLRTSFSALFDAEDQETVRVIEDAIGESILPRAVLLLEALLVRLLERTGRTLGRAEAPHEAMAWALGLPAERYARLRATAQRARRGGEISRRDALEGLVLVSMAQIALDGVAR